MIDPRITPQSKYLELTNGNGTLQTTLQVNVPITNLYREPDGPRDRQMIHGEFFDVFGTRDGWVYGKTQNTQYIGFVRHNDLTQALQTNLRVNSQWATLYAEPNFKKADVLTLPYGALLTGTEDINQFWKTPQGYVPKQQVTQATATDPARVALGFLGTPYLWGGNSALGIDCSGLVQSAYLACGLDCFGDSDLMEHHLTGEAPTNLARNQLLFWKGHVALTISDTELVHANAHAMAVTVENIEGAKARILAAGDGDVTRHMQIPL